MNDQREIAHETALAARSDREAIGWDMSPGGFMALLPPEERNWLGLRRAPRSNSWLRPSTLWASRNDVVARLLGDPAEEQRIDWMRQERADPDSRAVPTIVREHRDQLSFLIVGDPGEGDASQYATVPAIEKQGDTEFMVICSDVIYPTGDTNQYLAKFYYPYKGYPSPIYAIPGNHDWYDGLNGFMQHFCAAAPLEVKPKGFHRRLRHALWRRAQLSDPLSVAAGNGLRPLPSQRQHEQSAPYWMMDVGPLQLVGIDTGIRGRIDGPQGQWLLDVSVASPKPKLLITGKPLMVDAKLNACELVQPARGADEREFQTVDEIVGEPDHNYVAVVGGDIHNYQRYRCARAGRELQYVVSGGGGAFMHATHKIGRLDPSRLHGADEARFVTYPLRGDSLAIYSHVVGKALGLRSLLEIPRGDAAAIMSKKVKANPSSHEGEAARVRGPSLGSRLRSHVVRHMGGRVVQRFLSEIFDWNYPPMFKSFLRVDVDQRGMRIRCIAATGAAKHEDHPPVVDDFTIDF